MSATLPGVRIKCEGASNDVGEGVDFGRLAAREGPIACARAPFSSARGALGPDVSGVDRGVLGHCAGPRQCLQAPHPEPATGPAIDAIVNRRGGTVGLGALAPSATGLQDVQDAGDHPSIIDPASSRLIAGKVRLDRRPLLVRQPEKNTHPSPPSPLNPLESRFAQLHQSPD